MPRSYQAYPQNAVVTHSPANVNGGDTSSAIAGGPNAFKIPPGFDVCAPVTGGTQNPFMAGLNTMGDGQNHTGVAGQTGNILSGLQQFTDSLCGFALGGTSVSEVLEAARNLRRRGGNLHETVEAIRRLRDTVGAGTTPQSVLSGVEAVSGAANANPIVASTIAQGQTVSGATGNQALDGLNGAQSYAGQGNLLLTGTAGTNPGVNDLLSNSSSAINQNTSNHSANQSLSTAQSVSLKEQNLLVSQDFHSSYSVVSKLQWSWDGTDGAPSTNAPGCAKCTCNGFQTPLISSEIPVVAGETIEVSAMVKWSGLTYSGASPVVLGVEKYRLMKDPAGSGKNVYSDIGWSDVYTVPTPGASSTGLTGTTNGWLGIAGTYTVEPGVDQLRFRLDPHKNATGGWVKWDDAEFLKLDLIPAEAVPGLTDNIVTQLYGSSGSGFIANDAARALADTRSQLTSAAAEIAALQAEGHTGAIAADDFSWTGALLGNANWTATYTSLNSISGLPNGSYAANGNDAVFTPSQGHSQSCFFIWSGTDATSTTDYQLVQLVLDSSLQTSSGGDLAFISLRARIASGGASYIDSYFCSNGTYGIGYWVGGTFTALKTGSCPAPGAGSTLTLYCGDKANTVPRRYSLQVGNVVIGTFDDTGTGSPLGSGNRGWGWGAEADSGPFTAATAPAINQWLALDQ